MTIVRQLLTETAAHARPTSTWQQAICEIWQRLQLPNTADGRFELYTFCLPGLDPAGITAATAGLMGVT